MLFRSLTRPASTRSSTQTLGVLEQHSAKSSSILRPTCALEEALSKSTSIASAKKCPPSSVCSLLEALNQKSAPALRRGREQMLVSHWGPLLRMGSAFAIREASVVGLLSSGCEPSVPPIHPAPGCKCKAKLFALPPGATVRSCKPRIAHPTRRLTLPSSGHTTAGCFRPPFHSGPSLRRLREPLMSNVRPHKRVVRIPRNFTPSERRFRSPHLIPVCNT